jgi:hypothetical protein
LRVWGGGGGFPRKKKRNRKNVLSHSWLEKLKHIITNKAQMYKRAKTNQKLFKKFQEHKVRN